MVSPGHQKNQSAHILGHLDSKSHLVIQCHTGSVCVPCPGYMYLWNTLPYHYNSISRQFSWLNEWVILIDGQCLEGHPEEEHNTIFWLIRSCQIVQHQCQYEARLLYDVDDNDVNICGWVSLVTLYMILERERELERGKERQREHQKV